MELVPKDFVQRGGNEQWMLGASQIGLIRQILKWERAAVLRQRQFSCLNRNRSGRDNTAVQPDISHYGFVGFIVPSIKFYIYPYWLTCGFFSSGLTRPFQILILSSSVSASVPVWCHL